MADGFDFDFSDITRLAGHLEQAPKKAGPLIRKALEVTSVHVKESWQDPLGGSETIPQGPRSISYDLIGYQGFGATVLQSDIGPTVGDGGVGGLVGALEYGIPGKTGPNGFGALALQANEEDFHTGLDKALEDAEQEAGL